MKLILTEVVFEADMALRICELESPVVPEIHQAIVVWVDDKPQSFGVLGTTYIFNEDLTLQYIGVSVKRIGTYDFEQGHTRE